MNRKESQESPLCDAYLAKFADDDVFALIVPIHDRTACRDCLLKKAKLKPDSTIISLQSDGTLPKCLKVPKSAEEPIVEQKPKPIKVHNSLLKKKYPPDRPDDVDAYLLKKGRELPDGLFLIEIKRMKRCGMAKAREYLVKYRKQIAEEDKEKANRNLNKNDTDGTHETTDVNPEPTKEATSVVEAKYPSKKIYRHAAPAVYNAREEMPWAPSFSSVFKPNGKLSMYDQEKQERYNSICQNLMMGQPPRFHTNMDQIKDIDKDIDAERVEFNKLYLDWQSENEMKRNNAHCWSQHPLGYTNKKQFIYTSARWRAHWKNDTRRFDRRPVNSISWTEEHRNNEVVAPIFKELLQQGAADEVQMPNVTKKMHLDCNKIYEEYPLTDTNKNKIEDDQIATDFCVERGVEVAMDATTACHLMSGQFEGRSMNYAIPVSVTSHVVAGRPRKVVILGKPRVMGEVSCATTNRQHIKYLLKANFIKKKPVEPEASAVTKRRTSGRGIKSPVKPATSDAHLANTTTDSQQTTDEPPAKKDKPERSEEKPTEGNNTNTSFMDTLDAILPGLSDSIPTAFSYYNKKSKTGRHYSLFQIGRHQQILIRSRPAPICTVGHPALKNISVSIQPRVEYAPNAGAMALGPEETMWNFAKEKFKMSAEHALLRTHYRENQVLQVHLERTNNSKIRTIEQDEMIRELVTSRTVRFGKLIDSLLNLKIGNYLILNENDKELKILQETDAIDSDTLICSKMAHLIKERKTTEGYHIADVFYGFERRVPLQWQIVQKRMPVTFVAADCKAFQTGSPSKFKSPPFVKNRGRGKQQHRHNNMDSEKKVDDTPLPKTLNHKAKRKLRRQENQLAYHGASTSFDATVSDMEAKDSADEGPLRMCQSDTEGM